MIDLDTARELVRARRLIIQTWDRDTYAEGYDDALCWAWEVLDKLILAQADSKTAITAHNDGDEFRWPGELPCPVTGEAHIVASSAGAEVWHDHCVECGESWDSPREDWDSPGEDWCGACLCGDHDQCLRNFDSMGTQPPRPCLCPHQIDGDRP